VVVVGKLRNEGIPGKEESMHDLSRIKSTVARDPLPFLTTLYGDTVKRTGNTWRIGSKGGRCFDTRKGELLCVTFNGDAGQGDCIEVWQAHHQCDFPAAIEQIAALYGISAGDTPFVAKPPRPSPEPRPKQPLQPWRSLKDRAAKLWDDAAGNLLANATAQAAIAEWRGWPLEAVKRLATASLIGYTEFDRWPSVISPQPAAFFRVMHPVLVRNNEGALFWHWYLVQFHIRFRPDARWRNDRPLSWIYAPTMTELAVTEGAHAPLIVASWSRDPEQPGYGTRCECIIVCAGEWDALTIVVAMNWIDKNGFLTIPQGIAVVGIRSEGRGGTDAFLRWYHHWHPRSAILLADADATGSSWFESTDRRPCFAEQLERRGMQVLARAPRLQEGVKDVNDLYRAGLLHRSHIDEMLKEAGFTTNGGAR
jgi:hypothetical protein